MLEQQNPVISLDPIGMRKSAFLDKTDRFIRKIDQNDKNLVFPVLNDIKSQKSATFHLTNPNPPLKNIDFSYSTNENSKLSPSVSKTLTKTARNSIFYDKRQRNFDVKLSDRINIFYGLLYVQYEGFLRNDYQIQQVIIRDILKMLLDKASTLKNILNNVSRMKRILGGLRKSRQAELNIKLETIVGLINYISRIILLDFQDSYQELGIKKSPIFKNEMLMVPIRNEMRAFEVNSRIFTEIVDFFRDCLDCFFILLRQRRKKLFEEQTANDLIKAISESRFSIGKLYEEYLIHEKILDENEKSQIEEILQLVKKKKKDANNKRTLTQKIEVNELESPIIRPTAEIIDDKKTYINKNDKNSPIIDKKASIEKNLMVIDGKSKNDRESNIGLGSMSEADMSSNKKLSISGLLKKPNGKKNKEKEYNGDYDDKMEEKLKKMEKLKVLNTLMQNKFKFQSSKFITRESKITLNTMKGNLEKQVLLEADQIKNEKVIADNRKKIMLARMTNPFGFTTGSIDNINLMKKLGF